MVVQLLKIDQTDFRGLLDLSNNFLSEVIEVLFGVHELLEVDHGVEVTHDEELVLTASHVNVNLVHRNVLRVASVRVLLHLRIVVLHLTCWDVEGEGGTLLNVVKEVPRSRRVSVLVLAKTVHFSRREHLVKPLVVRVLNALIVLHLKHA